MRAWLEKHLGANWRTSVSGIGTAIMALLTALAAAPYTLGDVALIIPPDWKPSIFKASALATVILKIINSLMTKDKAVSGTPATGQVVGATAGEPVHFVPVATATTEPGKE